VTVLIERQLDEIAETKLRIPGCSVAATAVPPRRDGRGRGGGTTPVARRGVSCTDEVEVGSCRASRGTRARGRGRQDSRRSTRRGRRRRGRTSSSSGRSCRVETDAALRDARCTEGLRRILDQRDTQLRQLVPALPVARTDARGMIARVRVVILGGNILGVEVERHRVDVREPPVFAAAPGDRLPRSHRT